MSRRGCPASLVIMLWCVALSACSNDAPSSTEHMLQGAQAITQAGFGQIEFVSQRQQRIQALVYRSNNFDPQTGAVVFVLHGAKRNPGGYLAAIAPVIERRNALAIAIEFSRELYPKGSDYTLGVTSSGRVNAAAYRQGRWLTEDAYTYREVERLFSAIRAQLGGQQTGYYLFGHSAGAQFTHRLLTFVPDARVIRAVAANAGWYTLPVATNAIPYGLADSPHQDDELDHLFERKLTLLLGARDIANPAQDDQVRGTPQAMAQGQNRLARGQHYFQVAQSAAARAGQDFNWRLALVPEAGHEVAPMAAAADLYLFGDVSAVCTEQAAPEIEGLIITEILADPPKERLGDANGDGKRSANQDEFVEFRNRGADPVCLSGWVLRDATNKARHVFPEGTELASGETLVVFGGGVPTGTFNGAVVQWAAQGGGLNLTNRGDVLTLSDHTGAIAQRISWGDCAGVSCAANHIDQALNTNSSFTRQPANSNQWQRHLDISSDAFSPGAAASQMR